MKEHGRLYQFLSSEIGGWALIGAWALKGRNRVLTFKQYLLLKERSERIEDIKFVL